MASRRILTPLLTLVLLLPAVAHAELWRYETESGSVAFTDDAERIPARYAEKAVKLEDRSLQDYERTTISERGASIESAVTTIDLEALDEEQAGATGSSKAGAKQRVNVYVDGRIQLDVEADSDEPIYVDKGQYVLRKGILSPHTIVSRGGKTLIVIDERP